MGHDKLHGSANWTYYYLYVILDIYSRYAVGWMLATCESAVLAEKLIADTATKQGITRGQLILYADRRSSMTPKPVAFLSADLGATQSHSRPMTAPFRPVITVMCAAPTSRFKLTTFGLDNSSR